LLSLFSAPNSPGSQSGSKLHAVQTLARAPKLPDFAVVDTATPPDDRWPGKVAAAGFFGEHWELLEPPGRQTLAW